MSLTATYDSVLSRVRLAGASLGAVPSGHFERSIDGVNWTTVRGGLAVTVTAGSASVDDYEFVPDVANTYRVTTSGGTTTATPITPTLGGVWVKVPARPYLNRQITVLDFSEIERSARGGLFPVVGRSYPVAVTELHGSKRWTMQVLTDDPAEARDFDLILALGEVLFIHVPAECDVPGGYVVAGDTSERRPQRKSVRRIFDVPCTEVAAPGADVIGYTATWQTIVSSYATWADLIADKATWDDVLEIVASPSEVLVP